MMSGTRLTYYHTTQKRQPVLGFRAVRRPQRKDKAPGVLYPDQLPLKHKGQKEDRLFVYRAEEWLYKNMLKMLLEGKQHSRRTVAT